MSDQKEQLNEMNQFMNIVRDNAPINERFGEIELGGNMHPQHRVPIEFYDEFKSTYPGSRVRFRGPKRGKQNTSYSDATHFYIVSKKGEAVAPPRDELPGMRAPHRPEDRPHTPGYNKLEPASRAAADSRAQAFIHEDDDEPYFGQEEEAAYDALRDSLPRETILGWMQDYELVGDAAKIDDAVYDWFLTKYVDDGVEHFDGEDWHNWLADFVADNRAITEAEGFNLDSIVESVLEEFEGQPKDYVDPEDNTDEIEAAPKDDYSGKIEDEELGLRFD